jgi:hypothetical protein
MEAGKSDQISQLLLPNILIFYRNRDSPSGYKISMVPFENGQPLATPDNTTASMDVFGNLDNKVCPEQCFRPAGLAFDNNGRLFMTSDASGEIYVVIRDSPSDSKDSNGRLPSQAWPSRASPTGLIASVLLAVSGYLARV